MQQTAVIISLFFWIQNFGNNYEELLMEFNGYACRESNGNTEGDCFVLDNSDPTINALGEAFVSL